MLRRRVVVGTRRTCPCCSYRKICRGCFECDLVLFWFLLFLFSLTKYVLFVLVGSEYVLGGVLLVVAFCFGLFPFVLPVASPGGRDLVEYPSVLTLGVFSLPLFGLPLLFAICSGVLNKYSFPLLFLLLLVSFLFSLFSFFHCVFRFSLFQCIWVAGVLMLCLSCPVRWHISRRPARAGELP